MVGPPGWTEGIPSSVYCFGDFRLDPARRELVKGNEMIELPSSSFDCLVYLIQHRERAVGRDELISAVWGRADISDNLLSQTLVRVRRALGEAASDRSSIRTVTKFGYRWIATTRAEPIASEAPRAANDPDAPLTDRSVQTLTLETDSAPANEVLAPAPVAPGDTTAGPPSPTISFLADARAAPPQAHDAGENVSAPPPLSGVDATAFDRSSISDVTPIPPPAPLPDETGIAENVERGTATQTLKTPDTAPDVTGFQTAAAHTERSPLAQPAEHDRIAAALAAPAAARRSVARRGPRTGILLAAVVATALAVLATYSLLQRRPTPTPHADAPTTTGADSLRVPALVLPVDVRAAADWDWLRLGLMDLIANRLRQGGIVTLDSQSVYPLLGANPDLARARPDAELGLAALSRQRIYASAVLQAAQWHVRITSVDAARRVDASGSGSDVIAAARVAVDNLLVSLGRVPPSPDHVSNDVQALLERSDVALLTNRPQQARELIEQAPATLRDDVRVQVRLAEIDIRSGQLAAARTRLQPLLPQLAAPGVELVRARALNALALIAAVGAAPSEATPLLDESMHLAERFDSPADQARALHVRALQEAALGRPDDALAHLAKARVLFEAVGDPLRVAGANLQAADTAANIGRYHEAQQYLTQAEATLRAFGAVDQLAFARATQVMLRLALLENRSALALSDSDWPPSDAINNDRTRHFVALARAFALLRNGRLSEADALFARVSDAADAPQQAMARRNAALGRADVALQRGAFAQALASALPLAHATAADENACTVRYLAWRLALAALRRSGDAAQAHSETLAFGAWAAALDATPSLSPALVRDARFYAALERAIDETARGDLDAALPHFDTQLAAARELQIPQRLVDVAAAEVPALLAAGHVDEAGNVAGFVALWADADPDAAWAQALVYRALGETEAFDRAVERLKRLAGERVLPSIETPR